MGLNDGIEVNKLGTFPTTNDSDGDVISDTLEIRGFQYAGRHWYLDPNEIDTNKDGLPDNVECSVWAGASIDSEDICPDSDGDGTPDVFDYDNDNDGVADAVDLSPFTTSADLNQTFSQGNPLNVSMDNLSMNKPVIFEMQFRPTDTKHLSYFGSIFDWPTWDTTGQIQRRLNTTFANTENSKIVSDDPRAGNGDIRLVPMLEVTMPYTNGHYANLPITPTINVTDTPRTLANV